MTRIPSHVSVPVELPEALLSRPCVLATLALLLGHFDCAGLLEASVWDFAADGTELEQTGLGPEELRALLDAGYVEDRIVVERRRVPGRTQHGSRMTTSRALFGLTLAGALRARAILQPLLPQTAPPAPQNSTPPVDAAPDRPRWEADCRKLWLGGQLVRRFKRSAPNQHRLLAVFEEEGWPDCVADPLPPSRGVDAVQRLRDTVKSLNRTLRGSRLHFSVDPDGTQVRWEVVR